MPGSCKHVGASSQGTTRDIYCCFLKKKFYHALPRQHMRFDLSPKEGLRIFFLLHSTAVLDKDKIVALHCINDPKIRCIHLCGSFRWVRSMGSFDPVFHNHVNFEFSSPISSSAHPLSNLHSFQKLSHY